MSQLQRNNVLSFRALAIFITLLSFCSANSLFAIEKTQLSKPTGVANSGQQELGNTSPLFLKDSKEAKPKKYRALVTKVKEDHLKIKTSKGSLILKKEGGIPAFHFTSKQLVDIPTGTQVWALGRVQEQRSETGRRTFFYSQVQAIVAVEGFSPPPLSKKQKDQKLKWEQAPLNHTGNGAFQFKHTTLMSGKTRHVLLGKRTFLKKIAFKKKMNLECKGVIEKIDKKKHLDAAYVVVFPGKKFPASEFKVAYPKGFKMNIESSP